MKRNILFIIVILSLLSSSGCFEFKDKGLENFTLKYVLTIESDNGSNYSLYVPTPVFQNGENSIRKDDIDILFGVGDFEIVDTNHGNALKIIGNRSIGLVISINNNERYESNNGIPILSMDKKQEDNNKFDGTDENAEYYVFCECNYNSSFQIDIDFRCEYVNTKSGVAIQETIIQSINGNAIDGWNILNGEKQYIMT